jgi:UDP-N-acetyl-D-mannosaminuronic acid transferase (WecB/TagA/CpsF family)
MTQAADFRRILGINFFTGSVKDAVDRMEGGGLLVVPAAPALKDLGRNAAYREALEKSDLCIADSGLMVMLWNLLEHDSIRKVSGLLYLRELLARPSFHEHPEKSFWVMANAASGETNLRWLHAQGIDVPAENCYVAPFYGTPVSDAPLLEKLERLRPRHVFLTIGGGTQERLGLYLKQNLSYLPAIHCIGAAIAFITGDQVLIPVWGDRLGLGWLFRCISAPRDYVPRYWRARKLVPLMLRYRGRMPVMDASH